MVYNNVKFHKLPFSNAKVKPYLSRISSAGTGLGTGMGSVLLRTAGGGSGSSYSDMDDYIRTTGINPYKRSSVTQPSGEGLKSLTSKLGNLSIIPDKNRKKKITMSF